MNIRHTNSRSRVVTSITRQGLVVQGKYDSDGRRMGQYQYCFDDWQSVQIYINDQRVNLNFLITSTYKQATQMDNSELLTQDEAYHVSEEELARLQNTFVLPFPVKQSAKLFIVAKKNYAASAQHYQSRQTAQPQKATRYRQNFPYLAKRPVYIRKRAMDTVLCQYEKLLCYPVNYTICRFHAVVYNNNEVIVANNCYGNLCLPMYYYNQLSLQRYQSSQDAYVLFGDNSIQYVSGTERIVYARNGDVTFGSQCLFCDGNFSATIVQQPLQGAPTFPLTIEYNRDIRHSIGRHDLNAEYTNDSRKSAHYTDYSQLNSSSDDEVAMPQHGKDSQIQYSRQMFAQKAESQINLLSGSRRCQVFVETTHQAQKTQQEIMAQNSDRSKYIMRLQNAATQQDDSIARFSKRCAEIHIIETPITEYSTFLPNFQHDNHHFFAQLDFTRLNDPNALSWPATVLNTNYYTYDVLRSAQRAQLHDFIMLCQDIMFKEFCFIVRGIEDEIGFVIQDKDGIKFRQLGDREWPANTGDVWFDQQVDVTMFLQSFTFQQLHTYFGLLIEFGDKTQVYYNNVNQQLNGYFKPLFCLTEHLLSITLFNKHTYGLNSIAISQKGVEIVNLDDKYQLCGLYCVLQLEEWSCGAEQEHVWPPASQFAWIHYFSPPYSSVLLSYMRYEDQIGHQQLTSMNIDSYTYQVTTNQGVVTLMVGRGLQSAVYPQRVQGLIAAVVCRLLISRLQIIYYEQLGSEQYNELFAKMCGCQPQKYASALSCRMEANGAATISQEAVYQLGEFLDRRVFLGVE